jgi:hypothetical protein
LGFPELFKNMNFSSLIFFWKLTNFRFEEISDLEFF